ncbi:MAG: alginate export family protein [Candidatus Omnitrophota bacterium]
MKRILSILLAVCMVALVAMPAFAEVQNIKLNGGITIKGIMRDNFSATGSGGGVALSGFSDVGARDFYNTATTLGVAADLTDNVSATMLLGNERDWADAGSNQTISALASYITMKEMLYSALTVKAGRLPLVIADGLIVGDGTTGEANLLAPDLSIQNQFDAIAGILDYDPLTVIIGTAKVRDTAQTSNGDIDLYVVDGIYKFEDDKNTVLDAYYATAHYSSADGLTGVLTDSGAAMDVNVLAACLTMQPVEALSAKLGIAYQFGDYSKTATSKRDLDAMAYDIGLNYAIDNEYAPKVGLKYVSRSGDDATSTTGDYKGWLALFENQTNGAIYDPNTNISAIALTATAVPADRLTVGIEYWMYTLAESQPAVASVTSTSDEAGTELDLMAGYAYTEDVNLGLSLAWFFPGDYYVSGNDETAMQAILSLGVKF